MTTSTLEVLASRIVARLATGDLTDATPAEIKTMLGLDQHLVIPSLFAPEADLTFYDGWVTQDAVTIEKISLFAHTAPTGADLQVDILIDGVAQTKLATLTAGATHEITDIADLNVAAGERVGFKYTQVGSTEPGNGVIVTPHFKIT
jgi:hypothetical protein